MQADLSVCAPDCHSCIVSDTLCRLTHTTWLGWAHRLSRNQLKMVFSDARLNSCSLKTPVSHSSILTTTQNSVSMRTLMYLLRTADSDDNSLLVEDRVSLLSWMWTWATHSGSRRLYRSGIVDLVIGVCVCWHLQPSWHPLLQRTTFNGPSFLSSSDPRTMKQSQELKLHVIWKRESCHRVTAHPTCVGQAG